MHPMLNIAVQAARNAGKVLLRYIDRIDTLTVEEKGRNDLVTEVDRLSEQEIVRHIHKLYPNHSILAEEKGHTKGNEYCWIIDPLDGTVNYIHGFPHHAISIALKYQNELEVGVIYDPVRAETFTAARGQGAQLNNRRIRVTQTRKLEESLIGTGFPFRESHQLKRYLKIFETIFPQTQGIRRAGSAALDLAYVAAGRLDGFWEDALKPWDMAAGALLIKESGGMVTDFENSPFYLDNGMIIAGNPRIHRAIFDIIEKILKEIKNNESTA